MNNTLLKRIAAIGLLFLVGATLAMGFKAALKLRTEAGYNDSTTLAPVRVSAAQLIAEGDTLYHEQQYSAALNRYETAARKDPTNPVAYLRIGQLYQLKNRLNEARQELLFALELDPQNTDALFRLTNINYLLRDFEEARQYAQQTLALIADQSNEVQNQVKLIWAQSALWLYDKDQAATLFGEVNRSQSDEPLALYYLALMQIADDPDRAAEQLAKVESLDPGELGPKAAAARAKLPALEEAESDYAYDVMVGAIYLEQNLPTLALDYLKRVADQVINYQLARIYLGYTYLQLGDFAEAEKQLLLSQQMGSGPDPLGYFYLGELYNALGKFKESSLNYEKAIDLGDGKWETFYHLGQVLQAQQDYSKAVRAYRRALQVKPADLQTMISTANVLINYLKDPGQAISLAEEAVQALPDNAKALNLLGWAQLSDGDWENAKASVQAALAIDPLLATAHFNLATIRENQGDLPSARESYQLALDLDFDGSIAKLADEALQRLSSVNN